VGCFKTFEIEAIDIFYEADIVEDLTYPPILTACYWDFL